MSPPSGARLTVDLGNSRCKFRLWKPERVELIADCGLELGDDFLKVAGDWLDTVGAPDSIAMCAVAQPDLERKLAEELARFTGFLPGLHHGLRIDCTSPETVGLDRLFAARGALELVGRAAIVVDCGTALTVDWVTPPSAPLGTEAGVFMGGAIAPGPKLLAAALERGGARLPEVAAAPSAPALGKNTREALEAGVAVGLRGAARELVAGLCEAAGGSSLPVVLTGGAAAFMTSGDPLAVEVIESPDLVHVGLLAAMATDERRAEPS